MRKLMLVTIGVVSSLVLCVYIMQLNYCIFLVPFSFALIIVLFLLRRIFQHWKYPAVILIGFLIGASLITAYDSLYLEPARQLDGKEIYLTATASDYSIKKEKNYLVSAQLELEGSQYKVFIYYNDDISFSPGDQISGTFRMRFTSVGGKMDTTYHQGNGIFLLAFTDGISYVRADSVPLKFYATEIRHEIIKMLDHIFPYDTQAFARALLLGDSSELSFAVDNAFKVSGIRHIIAVSGLHVSILFSLVYIAVGKRRLLTSVFGIPVLFIFAAIAGFTPSVVRACIMQGLMIVAMMLNKEYDPPSALSFAVLIMLLINPIAVTSVSLQLSAGCMVGIFCFSSKISNFLLSKQRLGPAKGADIKSKCKRWFVGSVAVSISAMVTTIPLCAYYFDMVSLIGIITNLLTLWVVSFIFYGIMISCILGFIWPFAGKLMATIVSFPIRYVIWIAEILSDVPYAAVYTCSIYTVFWLIFIYGLSLFFILLKKKRLSVYAVCTTVSLFITILATWLEPRLDQYRLTVFDVGQGQCVLLQSDNRNYLIDCGGENHKGVAVDVICALKSQGINSLDAMILTHYDNDHVGSSEMILSEISCKSIFVTIPDPETDIDEKLQDQYADYIKIVNDVTELEDANHRLSIFPAMPGKTGNESSLCVLFQSIKCDILITGDRSDISERNLIENYDIPQVDILVAGHHGAKDSTGVSLLSTVRPKYVIFSAGRNNQFNHPNPETVSRVLSFGCEIFRTDKQGTIILRG